MCCEDAKNGVAVVVQAPLYARNITDSTNTLSGQAPTSLNERMLDRCFHPSKGNE